jgi:UDP-glucose 4-epimerase
MNILVTGGLGFVGSHLVDLLVQNPENDVMVIDDLSSASASADYKNLKAKYLIADIREIINDPVVFSTLSSYVRGPYDVVYHLAARARIQPSFKKPTEYFDIDARGTCEVLEFARKHNAKVVYAGSSSAYGGPKLNPYAFSKYVGEELCVMYNEVFGVQTQVARFFNVYGTRQPTSGPYATVIGIFEDQTKNGEQLTITGDGEQRRDFTHISDIARGFVELAALDKSSNEPFSLGTGRNYSINELAALFENPAGTLYIPRRPGEAWITRADATKMLDASGWKAEVALEDYIKTWRLANLT